MNREKKSFAASGGRKSSSVTAFRRRICTDFAKRRPGTTRGTTGAETRTTRGQELTGVDEGATYWPLLVKTLAAAFRANRENEFNHSGPDGTQ